MDITAAGYLLFVIPGFFVVWTYRHFTAAKKIGEFEYAVWSFVWGVGLSFLLWWMSKWHLVDLPALPNGSEAAFWGGLLGRAIALALMVSFPLGFLGVFLSRLGLFGWIDKLLLKILDKLTKRPWKQ